MVSISIEHYSPEVATQWLLWLVRDINTALREQDKAEAQRSIDYLTVKLKETQLADMQTVFYQLIEEQTKNLMLAQVQDEFAFKIIDPAVVPEEEAGPKRALICVLAVLLGGMLGMGIVLIRFAFAKKD